MRTPRRIRLTYASVVSLLALALTVGGVAYAATSLPAGSVGTKQLAKNAVVGKKVKDGSLLATDVKGKKLPAGPAGKQGDKGPIGIAGVPGSPSNAKLSVMTGTVALGTANEFFAVSGPSTGGGSEPEVTMLSPNRPMIARSLSVRLNDAPGVGINRRIDVRINNLITIDLECVISHPATTCTSVGGAKDQLLIPANTRISMGGVTTGMATPTQAQFAFTLENAP